MEEENLEESKEQVVFKTPKLFGKDEDGFYKGIIEGIVSSKEYDILYISNRKKDFWIFSVFSHRQIGTFKVPKQHNFRIGDLVIVEKKNNTIVDVKKDKVTISNIDEIYKD